MAKKRIKPIIVAVVADLHINSTLGLMPRAFVRDDGETIRANRYQQALWRAWAEYWDLIRAEVKAERARLWVVINGDLVEGYHHGTTQIMCTNPADQEKLAIEILEPVARMAKRLFIVRGTPSHGGTAGHFEESLAYDVGAEPDDQTGTHSWWHLPLDANGVLFSFAHHRRMNTLPWTMGGAPNRLASETPEKYMRSGDKCPNVIVRSHGHTFDESSSWHPVKVIFTPAWQLKTEFSHKIAPDTLPDIGGLVFRCGGDGFSWDPVLYPFKRRPPWREKS